MFDVFLKIDGIPGESTDDKHKNWIEVMSFSHAMHQPASATKSSSGGASAERVDIEDFTVAKLLDKASPKIYEACAKGSHLKEVVVEMCRAGGDKLKYMEVKMENVMISSISTSGGPQGEAKFPAENVSFNFGKIKWTYTQQKRADGGGGGNVQAGWDLEANKAI